MIGLVTKSTGLWYKVKAGDQILDARLKGRFKLENKKITNPIAVGDTVEVEPNRQAENEWVIRKIKARANYLIRQSPRNKRFDHLIASNLDQGVLIVTFREPRTSIGFIDRFLISLEAFRIPGALIFNKKDLYTAKDLSLYDELKYIYEHAGYEVRISSFLEGVSGVRSLFRHKRTLLSGHSGSGKSTLINRLIPSADQTVGKISSITSKGIHATTFAELFFMDDDSSVIDTPGIKELGLAEVEPNELSHYFPEMREYLGSCKFYNCLHKKEPGCIVKKALGKEISQRRYESYLSILSGSDNRK